MTSLQQQQQQSTSTILSNFEDDLLRLLNISCNKIRCNNNCISFLHFQERWFNTSFSCVHLGHPMSIPTGGKQRRINIVKTRGYEKIGRDLLQGMYHTILTYIRTLYSSSSTQNILNSSIRAMYSLYCLHGTQLFHPPVPIRIDVNMIQVLIYLETKAIEEHGENLVSCVVAKLISDNSFRIAAYTGPTNYNFIQIATNNESIKQYENELSSSEDEQDDVFGNMRSVDNNSFVFAPSKTKRRRKKTPTTLTPPLPLPITDIQDLPVKHVKHVPPNQPACKKRKKTHKPKNLEDELMEMDQLADFLMNND